MSEQNLCFWCKKEKATEKSPYGNYSTCSKCRDTEKAQRELGSILLRAFFGG